VSNPFDGLEEPDRLADRQRAGFDRRAVMLCTDVGAQRRSLSRLDAAARVDLTLVGSAS
jgi:hypothetical protein